MDERAGREEEPHDVELFVRSPLFNPALFVY